MCFLSFLLSDHQALAEKASSLTKVKGPLGSFNELITKRIASDPTSWYKLWKASLPRHGDLSTDE